MDGQVFSQVCRRGVRKLALCGAHQDVAQRLEGTDLPGDETSREATKTATKETKATRSKK